MTKDQMIDHMCAILHRKQAQRFYGDIHESWDAYAQRVPRLAKIAREDMEAVYNFMAENSTNGHTN